MLAACGTSHVNKSCSAGTSTTETDSNLIDLTCPLMTCTELSAAPLDCGRLQWTCLAPRLQSKLASPPSITRRWRALCHIEKPLCDNPKCPSLERSSSPTAWKSTLLRESSEQRLTWSLHRAPPGPHSLRAVPPLLH